METTTMTGAILAGGLRAELGGVQKALLPFGGESLIAYQIRRMKTVCEEVIVVTDNPKPLLRALDPDVRIITDYFEGSGPLGGIHAALHLARHSRVWIAGCHMPFLSVEAARRLKDNFTDASQAVLPMCGNRPVPLHGVYDKACADPAAKLLSRCDISLHAFLDRIRWLGISAETWKQEPDIGEFDYAIHTEEEYRKALQQHCHRLSTKVTREV